MNNMRISKDGKIERTETKMEKANGTIWREGSVPYDRIKCCQFVCEPHGSRDLCWSS